MTTDRPQPVKPGPETEQRHFDPSEFQASSVSIKTIVEMANKAAHAIAESAMLSNFHLFDADMHNKKPAGQPYTEQPTTHPTRDMHNRYPADAPSLTSLPKVGDTATNPIIHSISPNKLDDRDLHNRAK